MRSFEGAHFAEGSDSDDEEKAAAEAEEKAAAEAKMAAAGMTIPAAPLAPPTTVDPAFLTHINTFIADKLKTKKELFTSLRDAARDIENKATIGLHKRQMGDADGAHADLNASITELRALLLTPGAAETPARSAVTHAAQSVACFQAFDAFLTTGTLGIRASQEVEYDDNEWLLGLISASHEISRYAIGRGTHADSVSVGVARDVTSALLEALLAFDLRNGPLRRSYDSLKYVVRRLEDTLYELSLTADVTDSGGSDTKAAGPFVDAAALEATRERYEAADAAREVAIKKCRDLQKLSKNAIFSLHRGQQQKAETQLEQACEGARALLASAETDQQANELRHMGAVKGVMEELLEAKLFAAWLASPGRILHCNPKELGVDATAEEYLGALGDFSGELGRYAVARATARDAASVRVCLGTCLSLQTAALQLGPLWPRGADKKAEALKHASRNMEKLLYEHSLSERTGRRGQQVEWGPEKLEEAALEKEE